MKKMTTIYLVLLSVVVGYSAPIRSIVGAHSGIDAFDAKEEMPYWGLCFTAEEPNVIVNMTKVGSPPYVSLETSRDGVNWEPFDADEGTTPIMLIARGSRVYFRAGESGNARLASSSSAYRSFTLSGLCGARGDVTSLLSRDFPVMSFSQGYAMFRLFFGCTSLTTAPTLPTMSLTNYCYHEMFRECSSLTTPPVLPATRVILSCYHGMFYGCSSLLTAPELPDSVAINCFREMFRNCTSLTIAPKIWRNATSNACYVQMFRGCSSLNEIEVAFTTFSGSYQNLWLSGVAANGTFRCPTALGTNETIARGPSACPEGWTVVNTD